MSGRSGFFVSFESPEAALACAVAIQRKLAEHRQTAGFAPQVRIGVHAAAASQVGKSLAGKGVHEAARISGQANGGEIIASVETAAGTAYTVSQPRTLTLKGISEPVDTVLDPCDCDLKVESVCAPMSNFIGLPPRT